MKKLFLILLLILFISFPCYSQMAWVQDDDGTASGTTVDVAAGSDVTSGNCIVGGVTWISGTVTLSSITQQAGTATTSDISIVNNPTTISNIRIALFKIKVTGSGSLTVRATLSGSVTKYLLFHEASGGDSTCSIRGSAAQGQTNPGTGTDALDSGTASPAGSTSGDYVFGYFTNISGAGVTFTAGTGFTIRIIRTNIHFSESRVTADDNATGTWTLASGNALSGVLIITQAASAVKGTAGTLLR